MSNSCIVYTVQVFPTLELFNEQKGSVMAQFKGSSNAPSFDLLCIRPAAGVSSLSVNTIIAAGLCRSPRLHLYACVSEEIKQHCPTFSMLWSLIIMLCCRLNKSITRLLIWPTICDSLLLILAFDHYDENQSPLYWAPRSPLDVAQIVYGLNRLFKDYLKLIDVCMWF